MVARSFYVFDNDDFVVTSSSASGIVGNGIINASNTPNGTRFTYTDNGAARVTLQDTGGNPDVFEDDQSGSHIITDGGGLVGNGRRVEAESKQFVRALDANGNPTGPIITITVFSQNGSTTNVWGMNSDVDLIGGTSYVKISGSNTGSTRYDSFVTCFAKGTVIDTPDGARPIETLAVGDLVQTRDDGACPVRWVGQRAVMGVGNFAPIRFAPGTLGNDAVLRVSPEHRMVVDGPMASCCSARPARWSRPSIWSAWPASRRFRRRKSLISICCSTPIRSFAAQGVGAKASFWPTTRCRGWMMTQGTSFRRCFPIWKLPRAVSARPPRWC